MFAGRFAHQFFELDPEIWYGHSLGYTKKLLFRVSMIRALLRSPGHGLSYHADSSRYSSIVLVFLLNHYAWVHVQYTPALGGNPQTPRTKPPHTRKYTRYRVQHQQSYYFMFLLDTILHQNP